jgi:hypothetical protein
LQLVLQVAIFVTGSVPQRNPLQSIVCAALQLPAPSHLPAARMNPSL